MLRSAPVDGAGECARGYRRRMGIAGGRALDHADLGASTPGDRFASHLRYLDKNVTPRSAFVALRVPARAADRLLTSGRKRRFTA